MPVNKLKEFLDRENIRYVSIIHSRAFTAQATAESAHISGKELAKTVMVKINGKMAMAVLPASEQVDMELLRGALQADAVTLANEDEFQDLFPQCEIGAMPPFGNLYNLAVYVEETLTEDQNIAFNAGSHTELIQLSYDDYARLTQPKVLKLSAKYTTR